MSERNASISKNPESKRRDVEYIIENSCNTLLFGAAALAVTTQLMTAGQSSGFDVVTSDMYREVPLADSGEISIAPLGDMLISVPSEWQKTRYLPEDPKMDAVSNNNLWSAEIRDGQISEQLIEIGRGKDLTDSLTEVVDGCELVSEPYPEMFGEYTLDRVDYECSLLDWDYSYSVWSGEVNDQPTAVRLGVEPQASPEQSDAMLNTLRQN